MHQCTGIERGLSLLAHHSQQDARTESNIHMGVNYILGGSTSDMDEPPWEQSSPRRLEGIVARTLSGQIGGKKVETLDPHLRGLRNTLEKEETPIFQKTQSFWISKHNKSKSSLQTLLESSVENWDSSNLCKVKTIFILTVRHCLSFTVISCQCTVEYSKRYMRQLIEWSHRWKKIQLPPIKPFNRFTNIYKTNPLFSPIFWV